MIESPPLPATRRLPAPDNTPSPETQLTSLAEQIAAYQRGASLSATVLTERYPAIGSSKTLKRFIAGDYFGDVSNWVTKYAGVLTQIANDEQASDEAIYPDLLPAVEVRYAMLTVMRQRGIARFVLVEGGSGSGKTTALRLMEKQHPGTVIYLEASEAWRSPTEALGAIYQALTGTQAPPPLSFAHRERCLVEWLGEKRLVLAIDESHHMCGSVLNVLKTIINKTQCAVVCAGMDTLWRKLAAANSEEAKQLLHNRMLSRIKLGRPDEESASMFLQGRTRMTEGDLSATKMRAALTALCDMAADYGHFSFLRKVAEELVKNPKAPRTPAGLIEMGQHVKHSITGK